MPKHIFFVLTILFLVTSLPSAQPIAVSIPDTVVIPGSDLILPVRVGDVTGREISSILMNLSYSSSVLTATNVSANGTISSGSIVEVNVDIPGRILVAIAGTPMEGAGILVFLQFTVSGSVGDTTTIHFDDFMFGEGVPVATTKDGFVRIRPSSTGTIVWVRASEDSVYYGQTFWAEIWAENVTDLGVYQFTLGFDPDLVNATSARNGPFLGSTGRTPVEIINVIDNTNGIVTLRYFSEGSFPGPNGGGILGIIEFEANQNAENASESFKLQIGLDQH